VGDADVTNLTASGACPYVVLTLTAVMTGGRLATASPSSSAVLAKYDDVTCWVVGCTTWNDVCDGGVGELYITKMTINDGLCELAMWARNGQVPFLDVGMLVVRELTSVMACGVE
jgi:hypothetical protein